MEQSGLTTELTKAIPILVGGALAILGGIAGQIISHHLYRSRDRASLMRERVEMLVKALYAHARWLRDKETAVLFRGIEHDVPSPFGEAQMLQKLYFPELAPELLAIREAEIPMIKFIGEQQLAKMKDLNAWIKAWNPDPYYNAYNEYMVALEVAVRKCRDHLISEIGI